MQQWDGGDTGERGGHDNMDLSTWEPETERSGCFFILLFVFFQVIKGENSAEQKARVALSLSVSATPHRGFGLLKGTVAGAANAT